MSVAARSDLWFANRDNAMSVRHQHSKFWQTVIIRHIYILTASNSMSATFSSSFFGLAKLRRHASGVSFRSATMSAITTSSRRFVRSQRRWQNGMTYAPTNRLTGVGARDTCVSKNVIQYADLWYCDLLTVGAARRWKIWWQGWLCNLQSSLTSFIIIRRWLGSRLKQPAGWWCISCEGWHCSQQLWFFGKKMTFQNWQIWWFWDQMRFRVDLDFEHELSKRSSVNTIVIHTVDSTVYESKAGLEDKSSTEISAFLSTELSNCRNGNENILNIKS